MNNNSKNYIFNLYSSVGRWVSYFHQINETLKLSPVDILEVGVGDGVFGSYIKNNTKINYQSMDLLKELNPDIVGNINKIPLADNSVDLVVAFEVLEHLPFEDLAKSLEEIRRVTRKNAIISLPHFGPAIKLSFKLPFLKEIKLACKFFFPLKHKFNGEHYWEIGKFNFGVFKIRRMLKNFFEIKNEFIPFENQYHHFFVLEKKI